MHGNEDHSPWQDDDLHGSPRHPMPTPRPRATADAHVTSDRVLVARWTFAPGAETGWHRHAHDYVVVPITDGTLLVEDTQGSRHVALKAGVAYARLAGVEHNVVNAGDSELVFVEVEMPGA